VNAEFCLEYVKGRNHLGDLFVEGRRDQFIKMDIVERRRHVTDRKVAGSRPDELNDFYQVT
jgi:hypothetical protein